jgi:hypothetical protein
MQLKLGEWMQWAECGFFPSPIFPYFIKRHIQRNQPPWQNIRDE